MSRQTKKGGELSSDRKKHQLGELIELELCFRVIKKKNVQKVSLINLILFGEKTHSSEDKLIK